MCIQLNHVPAVSRHFHARYFSGLPLICHLFFCIILSSLSDLPGAFDDVFSTYPIILCIWLLSMMGINTFLVMYIAMELWDIGVVKFTVKGVDYHEFN